MKNLPLWVALIACAPILSVRAASAGDEVVVVYNTRVPESKAVAEHYAERRQVPPSQVFGFALSTNEEFSRTEFQDSLQLPLAKALEKNKLWHIAPQTIHVATNLPASNRASTNQADRVAHPADPVDGRAPSTRVAKRVTESKIRYAALCYGLPPRIA